VWPGGSVRLSRSSQPASQAARAADEASDSPVGHVQEEGASSRVELEAEQPLELGDERVAVRRAHAAEPLHQLLVQVRLQVHALLHRGGGGGGTETRRVCVSPANR